MTDVVTFGEAMIRLAPPGFRRLEQATQVELTVGGAELNCAAGVSRLGLSAAWVSCLPDNPLGRMARNKARECGVDTAHLRWGPGRMGLYFVEYGASPRPSSVLYDRAHSAISELPDPPLDWPRILTGARLFHTTGITTGLSQRTAQAVRAAFVAARSAGVLISYDLNYRARLWTEAEARSVQEPLMSSVDILFTTEEDASRVFGVTGADYAAVACELADRYGIKTVVVTIRGDLSVWRNTWTAIAYNEGGILDDRSYEIEVVDRVGGGDAFAAGFIYGYLTAGALRGLQIGNAFSALKQSSWGDLNWATLQEVETQISGAGTRIVR